MPKKKVIFQKLKIKIERLRRESDIIRKKIDPLCLKPATLFTFIDEHRTRWNTKEMCRVLRVSRSGFYRWQKHTPSQREIDNQKLVTEIKKIYTDSKGNHGSPKITEKLRSKGWSVSKNRVARIMRKAELRSVAR